jgi:hypothetical protein
MRIRRRGHQVRKANLNATLRPDHDDYIAVIRNEYFEEAVFVGKTRSAETSGKRSFLLNRGIQVLRPLQVEFQPDKSGQIR